MTSDFEYSEEEIKEAIKFVIQDNLGRVWKNDDEFTEAVNNYLVENTVVSQL